MPIMSYEVTLSIDSKDTIVVVDDTYPSVNDWQTASEFAMHMILHSNPDAEIEFVDCSERIHLDYKKYGYIYPTQLTLQ